MAAGLVARSQASLIDILPALVKFSRELSINIMPMFLLVAMALFTWEILFERIRLDTGGVMTNIFIGRDHSGSVFFGD